VQQFYDLALHNLEMQTIEFQQNSVWKATCNEIRAELEMSEHIPNREQ